MGTMAIERDESTSTNSTDRLTEARQRMDLALGRLEAAVNERLSGGADVSALEQQIQHLTVDRGKMAEEIDALKRQTRELLAVNTSAVKRIDTAIDAVETVLTPSGADT